MYDAHYDLLTIIYFQMKQDGKYRNINKLIKELKNIYRNDNIVGGIINLYFMSEEEMKDELDINKQELLDVTTMFEESITKLNYLKEMGIIPKKYRFFI